MSNDLFGGLPDQVTLERQQECVERELKQREFVYPRRVEAGKMTKALADREITMMRAVRMTVIEHEKLRAFVEELARREDGPIGQRARALLGITHA